MIFAFPFIYGMIPALEALRRSFFENWDWGQRQTVRVENRRRSCFGRSGAEGKLTQVVDFHDNFRKFRFVFWLCGMTLIPNRAARLKSAKASSKKLPMWCAHCQWATLAALKAEKLRFCLNRLRPV
jgi:hypothetical protein